MRILFFVFIPSQQVSGEFFMFYWKPVVLQQRKTPVFLGDWITFSWCIYENLITFIKGSRVWFIVEFVTCV